MGAARRGRCGLRNRITSLLGFPPRGERSFGWWGWFLLLHFYFYFYFLEGVAVFKGPGRAACLKRKSKMGGLHCGGLAGGSG